MNQINQLSIFMAFILLVLIIINGFLNKERESFVSSEIVSEELEEPQDPSIMNRLFSLDLNQDGKSDIQQVASSAQNFMQQIRSPTDKFINNAYINSQINDAIKNEKDMGELAIKNNKKDELENIIDSEEINENPTVDMKEMFEKLENMEYLCNGLERKSKLKDNLEQIRINEVAIKELHEQEKQINELTKIVNHLRVEKERKDLINQQCRNKKQHQINTDYDGVKKMSNKGLLKNESVNVNLDLGLKENVQSLRDIFTGKKSLTVEPTNTGDTTTTTPNSDSSNNCSAIDKTKMIHVDKLSGKCMGCPAKILANQNL